MAFRLHIVSEALASKAKNKIGDPSKIVGSSFDYLSMADNLTPE